MPLNPLDKPGVPVIVTRNTPSRNLWNGDIGVTVEGATGLVVLFSRGDKVVACPVGLLPEHPNVHGMEFQLGLGTHDEESPEFQSSFVFYVRVGRKKPFSVG